MLTASETKNPFSKDTTEEQEPPDNLVAKIKIFLFFCLRPTSLGYFLYKETD